MFVLGLVVGFAAGIAGTIFSQKILSWLQSEETKAVTAIKDEVSKL